MLGNSSKTRRIRCQVCGQLVAPAQYHDIVSCALYNLRSAYIYSDPVNRDAATLRDHILTLEPERG